MNSNTIKLLAFFLSVFILVTVSSQIYLAFQDKAETQSAISYSTVEEIPIKGVFIRNEEVVRHSGKGVVQYLYPDGSKIARNAAVADVYASENDIITNRKIEELTQELEELNKAQNKGTTSEAQPEFLSGLIQEKYQDITASVEEKNLENVRAQRSELLTLMNIMQIVINKETDYNDRINSLNGQLSSLTAAKGAPLETVMVEESGYFVSYTDGYEDKLSQEQIEYLTVSQVEEVIQNYKDALNTDSTAIGKMLDSYKWKMACVLNNSAKKLTEGLSAQMNIASLPEPVRITVETIRDTDDPKKSLVILSCDTLNYQLVQHRVEKAEILLNNYEGIRIPRSAIRFRNGEKGVYIQLGEEILFRKINVIYEGGDYVLSAKDAGDGYLMLYDDIVVEGIYEDAVIDTLPGSHSSESEPQETQSETSVETSGHIVVGESRSPSSETTAATQSVSGTAKTP